MGMDGTRPLDPEERRYLRQVLADEDRARDKVDEILRQRDALLRALRWGSGGRSGVAPEEIRRATVSRHHPSGIGRATLQRATGRVRDQRSDEQRT
jgi:hypothetical protein